MFARENRKNDLPALRDAIDYFIDNLYEIIEIEK